MQRLLAVAALAGLLFVSTGVAQAATFYTGSDDRAIFDTNPNPGATYGFALDGPGGFHIGDTVTGLMAAKLVNIDGNIPMSATLIFYDATSSPTITQSCTTDTLTPDFSGGYVGSSSVAFTFSTPCVIQANAVIIGLIQAATGHLYYDYHNNSYGVGGSSDLIGLAGTVTGIFGIPPTLSPITLTSSNSNTGHAKAGDVVTLTFTADRDIRTPVVTIAGRTVSAATTTGDTFEASTTLTSADTEGSIPFTIQATSDTGVDGSTITATTDSSTVLFDRTAPVISINGGPADGSTSTSTPTSFTFVIDDNTVTPQCAWDGVATSSCGLTVTQALADGAHTFSVSVADAAGNNASTTRSFTIDATPPTLTIDAGPAQGSTIATSSVVFAFTAGADAATVGCSYDGAATTSCSSPFATTSADGAHTFAVAATDANGNTSYASRSFIINTVPPSTGGGGSGGGSGGSNGPPFGLPVPQGLPQGVVLGEQTQAIKHASEEAKEAILKAAPPIPTTPPQKPTLPQKPALPQKPVINNTVPTPPTAPALPAVPQKSGLVPVAHAADQQAAAVAVARADFSPVFLAMLMSLVLGAAMLMAKRLR